MLNIAVLGGFDDQNDGDGEGLIEFCQALGREIVSRGHTLMGGAQTELDRVVASAAAEHVPTESSAQRIQSWIARGHKPVHSIGRIINSGRPSWDPGDAVRGVPEPIDRADVVVLIKGFQGSRRAYWWASAAHKPVLPIAYFGGAAEEIYECELEAFDRNYGRRLRKEDYEQLNEVGSDYVSKAKRIVQLAEDIAHSQEVMVAMSYTQEEPTATELKNLAEVYKRACQDFQYVCRRVTEKNTERMITHEIMASISQSAFVLVDLTDLRPNVMYELGFAEGLGKPIIITARKGTDLPFDIKDRPVIFWTNDLVQLGDDLKEKIRPIAQRQGKRMSERL
jgi:hypothetical protein